MAEDILHTGLKDQVVIAQKLARGRRTGRNQPILGELDSEGIELARKEKVDLIVAVGGGSAIVSSGGIGVPYERCVGFLLPVRPRPKSLPLGVVLTIPAAGGESGPSSVVLMKMVG